MHVLKVLKNTDHQNMEVLTGYEMMSGEIWLLG